ncbi:nitrophenyl compound nitroreductase subunit ArsF family protein [Methanolobus sp. WCC4]|uniref:nitrophenyl compound nitroreductase subunit ArsF family protein n=1 Tax=Methanolobus sp. WCC4 TaxID=3125784 RepID=UPI0030F7FEA9
MKKILVILFVLTLLSSGCVENNDESTSLVIDSTLRSDPHIEVIHFHGMNQCHSCQTVGSYAEETVNTYFADELRSGKLVFRHVNSELPENKELVQRYGVAYSSLWIGTYTENGFSAEQNMDVWYKIDDKAEYMSYLSKVIDEKMDGI